MLIKYHLHSIVDLVNALETCLLCMFLSLTSIHFCIYVQVYAYRSFGGENSQILDHHLLQIHNMQLNKQNTKQISKQSKHRSGGNNFFFCCCLCNKCKQVNKMAKFVVLDNDGDSAGTGASRFLVYIVCTVVKHIHIHALYSTVLRCII